MEEPIPFIETLNGKLQVSKEAFTLLEDIPRPLQVVAIVGKYRTGKSYLMNRFFGTNKGFPLGATIQSKTKGIWLRTRRNPSGNGTLVVLDTEGLKDIEKEDNSHDMKLFTLTILLCKCLLYNAIGPLDEVIVQELHLVGNLADNIQMKDKVEEDGVQFSTIFPNFIFVLRDFFLKLEIDGNPCTADEYMEHGLKLKKGTSKNVREHNTPREAIKEFFPERKCFTMCRPVSDKEQLQHLDDVPEEAINEEFLRSAEEIIKAAHKLLIDFQVDHKVLDGPGYAFLASHYCQQINDGGIPCISTAVDSLREIECGKAKKKAVQIYEQKINRKLEKLMPVSPDQLTEIHTETHKEAEEHFIAHSLFDQDGKFRRMLMEEITNKFNAKTGENKKLSKEKCIKLLQEVFDFVDKKIESRKYVCPGGYKCYKEDCEKAVQKYAKTPGKGPMADKVLKDFMAKRENDGKTIIAADEELVEKEKLLAQEREETARIKEQYNADFQEKMQMIEQMIANQKAYSEHLDKLYQEFTEKQEKQNKEYKKDLEKKEREYNELIRTGMNHNAEMYETMIKDMKKEHKERENDLTVQMKELQEQQKRQMVVLDDWKKERETLNDNREKLKNDFDTYRREELVQLDMKRQQELQAQEKRIEEERKKVDEASAAVNRWEVLASAIKTGLFIYKFYNATYKAETENSLLAITGDDSEVD